MDLHPVGMDLYPVGIDLMDLYLVGMDLMDLMDIMNRVAERWTNWGFDITNWGYFIRLGTFKFSCLIGVQIKLQPMLL